MQLNVFQLLIAACIGVALAFNQYGIAAFIFSGQLFCILEDIYFNTIPGEHLEGTFDPEDLP